MAGMADFLYSPNGQAYNAYVQQQDNANRIQKDQLYNDRYQQMTPLEATHQSLLNQTKQAELPGVVGTSQSLAAKGQFDQTMLPSNIQTAQAGNSLKQDNDQVSQMANYGTKFGQISAVLDSVPAQMRLPVLQAKSSQFGLSMDDPLMKAVVNGTQGDPDKLPLAFQAASKHMAEASAAHIQKMSELKAQTDSQERIHSGNNAATITAATIAGDSRLQVAQAKAASAKIIAQAKQTTDPVAKLTILMSAPMEARTDEWAREVQDISNVVRLKGTSQGNQTGGAVVSGQEVPTAGGIQKSLTGSRPAGGAPSQQAGLSKEQVEAAGYTYEPGYMYAKGPDGGVHRNKIK